MKRQAKLAAASLLAAALVIAAFAKPEKSTCPSLTYSTIGHGPTLLLLHDSSSADRDWSRAAIRLAETFEVTLLDISELEKEANSVRGLRHAIAHLGLDASRISGSASGQTLALRYALSYPDQSQSFTLPQTGEDLEILADFINSTPISKS